jgi:cell division septal protein FtsQ
VSGTQNASPQLVSDYVQTILDDGSYHFLSRKNIFLYPKATLERAIPLFFPRIASARVSRPSLSSTELSVTVHERQLFALWCAPSGCYQMDSGGFIFANTDAEATSSEYVFEGGIPTTTPAIGQIFIKAHLPALVALLTGLGQSGFEPRGATIENDTDFSVPLVQGFTLKASFGENADTLVKNLNLVLSSDALQGKGDQLEYIDLRFGDRVYYKLLGQSETSGTPQ